MNYAIIAAGEGSRLVHEGIKLPKPLVKLNGVEMIRRLIDIFLHNEAESVTIIVNEEMTEVQEYLAGITLEIPFNVLVKSTPSSMHSFYEIGSYLKKGKFCLTTVDTVFREQDFSDYIRSFIADDEVDGMMGVTTYIDDEKPLYVDVEKNMLIRGFFDSSNSYQYVSGGIYGLTEKALPILEKCIQSGQLRMRNFQRQLVKDGLLLKAYDFSKVIDVDHAKDIKKAEAFLNEQNTIE